jgi:HSF-type DNA-binding
LCGSSTFTGKSSEAAVVAAAVVAHVIAHVQSTDRFDASLLFIIYIYYYLLLYYRFRKIKSDPLRLRDLEDSEDAKYWKFGHEYFCEGRPDLLAEIKKAASNPEKDNENETLTTLKNDIKEMRERINHAKNSLGGLKSAVNDIIEMDHQINHGVSYEPPAKRYKSEVEYVSSQPGVHYNQETYYALPSDEAEQDLPPYVPGSIAPAARRTSRLESLAGLSFLDNDDLLADFLDTDPLNHTYEVDQHLLDRLCNSIACIPASVQEKFVQHICNTLTNQYASQVESTSQLSMQAAQEMMKKPSATPTLQHPGLNGAVMAAYLAHPPSQI